MRGSLSRSLYNYKDPKPIPEMNTYIHYWYADGEEKERKLDVDYMKRNRIIKTYPVLFLPVFSFYFWDDQ